VKLDPGTHKVIHSVLALKLSVTKKQIKNHQAGAQIGASKFIMQEK
jgi:hypothetical protein